MCACEFDWSLFANLLSGIGSVLAAIITLFLYRFAKHELHRNNLTTEVDLYYRVKNELMNKDSLTLYRSILDGKLRFDSSSETFVGEDNKWSMYEVSLNFLGHVEDIAIFMNEGILSFRKVSDGFGSMILEIGNSKCIRDYISHTRITFKDERNENWSGFERIYLQIRDELSKEQKQAYSDSFPKYTPTDSGSSTDK
jgi:hypothetical protein